VTVQLPFPVLKWSRLLMKSAALALLASLVLAAPMSVEAADFHVTPSSLSSTFNSAPGGSTLYLASGNYGTFSGAAKGGLVTVVPEPGAAVTMAIDFNGAANVRVQGVTITSATIEGSTHDVTIAGSTFTGDAVIRPDRMTNANVVLDGNTHNGISPSGGFEGRISLTGGGNPSGVVIKNSLFSGGLSDGIQNGSTGTQILNNEFAGIHQGDPDVAHTDALQLYGSKQTVVRGNYFHDVEDCIMAPDGTDHEVIENNVCVTSGDQYGFTLGSDDGSTVRHNTLVKTGLRIFSKDGMAASTGTVIRDNVLPNLTRESGTATQDHNLLASGTLASSDLRGRPVFTGGASPSSYAGYLLASGSPGKGNASDGLDRGITAQAAATRPGTGGSGTGGPTATTPGANGSANGGTAVAGGNGNGGAGSEGGQYGATSAATSAFTMRVRKWTFAPVRPRVGARVVLTAPRPKGSSWKCRWRYAQTRTHKGCVTVYRFSKPGLKRIRLSVTDSSGAQATMAKRVRVLPRRHR
jgi:hypothetical protein